MIITRGHLIPEFDDFKEKLHRRMIEDLQSHDGTHNTEKPPSREEHELAGFLLTSGNTNWKLTLIRQEPFAYEMTIQSCG